MRKKKTGEKTGVKQLHFKAFRVSMGIGYKASV